MPISRTQFNRYQIQTTPPFTFLPLVSGGPIRPLIRNIRQGALRLLQNHRMEAFTSSEIYDYLIGRRTRYFLPYNVEVALHYLLQEGVILTGRDPRTGLRYYIII